MDLESAGGQSVLADPHAARHATLRQVWVATNEVGVCSFCVVG